MINIKPDIQAEVSKYMTLRPVGKNLRGMCPFHSERTPSFFVRPYSQTFVCYGCGEKGDVIDFVMATEKINFKEACKKLGIELKPTQKTFREIAKRKAVKKFKQWCDEKHNSLCTLYRELQEIKSLVRNEEDLENLARFYHLESLWLYQIEILQGNERAKFDLYKELVYGE